MTLPATTPQSPDELASALRQEAEFRARSIQQFREAEEKIRTQEAKIVELIATLAERDTYIHALHLEREKDNAREQAALGQKDAYIHQLHLEKASWAQQLEEARADVERFAWLAQRLQSDFSHVDSRLLRTLVRGLVRQDRALHGEAEAPLPGGDEVYHLDPSPFRVFKSSDFVVAGWIRPGSRAVAALRVRLRGTAYVPDAALISAGTDPQAFQFSIPVKIPVGHSLLRFEAADASGTWRSVLTAPIWRPDCSS
ncbi:hypothetical protein [Nibricoccus sp. IMCC34717]|uniref:hypothetical protein n=1 Tax=Nibricoccus sp. IMCC34717 TaxID=3034021 RepID=UPI00384FBE05